MPGQGTYAKQPAEDMAFVQSLGFGATPTFFVNDKVVEGHSHGVRLKVCFDIMCE